MGLLFLYPRPQRPDYELSAALSLALLSLLILGYLDLSEMPPSLEPVFVLSMWANLTALIVRYIVRVASCRKVYGTLDWFGVALRWPVALYINMVAVFQAWKTYLGSRNLEPSQWSGRRPSTSFPTILRTQFD